MLQHDCQHEERGFHKASPFLSSHFTITTHWHPFSIETKLPTTTTITMAFFKVLILIILATLIAAAPQSPASIFARGQCDNNVAGGVSLSCLHSPFSPPPRVALLFSFFITQANILNPGLHLRQSRFPGSLSVHRSLIWQRVRLVQVPAESLDFELRTFPWIELLGLDVSLLIEAGW